MSDTTSRNVKVPVSVGLGARNLIKNIRDPILITSDRSRRRSGDPGGWDDLLSAAHELRRLGMPPTEIHTVLVTDDPHVVRRLMELHRERLQERIADEVATVGRVEASLSEAIRARTRAGSAMTVVAGEETRVPARRAR